jgi:tetratricopeptide (TPR) repeat protein
MSLLYQAGDFETAMDYLLKANNYAINKNLPWKMYLPISEFYCKMGKTDSALSYWNLWNSYESLETHQRFQEYANSIRAQIYLKNNQPDSALPLFEKSIKDFNKNWNKDAAGALIGPLMLRAEVYKQKKNYKTLWGMPGSC